MRIEGSTAAPQPREVITNRMGRQDVELGLGNAELLQHCAGEPLPFVLDGGGPASWGCGRSFLGFAPVAWMQVTAGGEVRGQGLDATPIAPARADGRAPLDLLELFVAHFDTGPDDAPPFVVVALAYDLGRSIERIRGARPLPPEHLLLHVAAYDWMLVRDATSDCSTVVTRPGSQADAAVIADRLRALARQPPPPARTSAQAELRPDRTPSEHEAAVRRALEWIAAGDIYQVNLAQRFRAPAPDPLRLFQTLQRDHAMPFAAYLDLGDRQLVSNSPECLLALDGDELATFPIKGTRPRGADPADDIRLRQSLRDDRKERAEHVMIVDLERNDLGRVARTGSVRVPHCMDIESYPTLHHMVSRVEARLRPGVGVAELLRAIFPGGSITGAPKIRAMEVIDALEPVPRGFYTGAVGLLGRRWARLNIAIRTAEIHAGTLSYHAGGGIVADSEPQREQAEVVLKTTAFARALASLVA